MFDKLNLGVARGIITPEVGCMLYGYSSKPVSTGVHDDLTLTAYVFTYKEKKLLYVNSTLCVLRNDIAEELRKMIAESFGVEYGNVVLGTTHTHSGPSVAGMYDAWGGFNTEYYEEILKPVLLDTVAEAFENIEPVTMATAVGESDIGVNRRMWKEGTNSMWLGECPWGILNKKMVILSFKAEDGTVKGNFVYYGAHCTSAGASTLITRDWAGYMVDSLEEKTGGLTAFVLGPEGDVGPRKLLEGDSRMEQTEALGAYAAKEVMRVFESLSEYKDVTMDVKQKSFKIPLLPRIALDKAVECVESLSKVKEERGWLSTRETFEYASSGKVVDSYKNTYSEKEYEEYEQVVFRIGDVAFATFAYELFTEIGLRIEYGVKDLNVINTVCTNGQNGYLPNQGQVAVGGYEVHQFINRGVQNFPDDADYSVISATINNINELER